jgi:hypothetical protein
LLDNQHDTLFYNTKSCFIALFELIFAVPVDKFTICKKREVRSQEPEWEPEKSEAIENDKSGRLLPEIKDWVNLYGNRIYNYG